MNIEELNNCFDCVTPTKEQKDRMFKAVMDAKNQPVKIVKFNGYKYLSTVAAVVVVGFFAVAYSYIGGFTKNQYIPEVAVDDTSKDIRIAEEISISDQETTKENILTPETEKLYPKFNDTEKQVDTKVAVADEIEDNENIMVASEGDPGIIRILDEQSAEKNDYEMIDIQENIVYSYMLPAKFTEGFEFANAFESDSGLETFFETTDGRSMSIKFMKKDVYEPYQQIIIPQQIAIIPNDGYMEFALELDDYYVTYYVETENAEEVYNMVVSSPCFEQN